MISQRIFDKRNPTEGDKHFIPLPSDSRHYVHHEKMSADKLLLYALIIDYYNPVDGYAFPSIETLAVKYGKSPDTTSKHIKDLKEVGLIDFPKMGYYVPLVPLDEAAFFERFPAAWESYRERYERAEQRKKEGRERMRQWRVDLYAE